PRGHRQGDGARVPSPDGSAPPHGPGRPGRAPRHRRVPARDARHRDVRAAPAPPRDGGRGQARQEERPGVLHMVRDMSEAPVPEPSVLVEKRADHIAVVTLNRPEKLNALNANVRGALMGVFADLADDDDVRAVVLHGAGEKAFVAGADITEFAARTADEQREVYRQPRIYE